jgi:hypothetical protein
MCTQVLPDMIGPVETASLEEAWFRVPEGAFSRAVDLNNPYVPEVRTTGGCTGVA